MTVAELIADLQTRDPNALVVVMPYSDPDSADEVTAVRETEVVVSETASRRRHVWRVWANVPGLPIPAVALYDGT